MAGEAKPRVDGRVERETVGPSVVLPRMKEVDEGVGGVEGKLGEARIGRDGPAAGNLRKRRIDLEAQHRLHVHLVGVLRRDIGCVGARERGPPLQPHAIEQTQAAAERARKDVAAGDRREGLGGGGAGSAARIDPKLGPIKAGLKEEPIAESLAEAQARAGRPARPRPTHKASPKDPVKFRSTRNAARQKPRTERRCTGAARTAASHK